MTTTTKELLALVGAYTGSVNDGPMKTWDAAIALGDACAEALPALCAEVEAQNDRIAQQDATIARMRIREAHACCALPLIDYHEDDGHVTWWAYDEDGTPADEPAWIGSPLDSDWPGYHTHWTPHPPMPVLLNEPFNTLTQGEVK